MNKIKLDYYFKSTKCYYEFFDALFRYETLSKELILENLKINYRSYRTEKTREKVKNNNINKLLEYFNVNKTNDLQMDYEELINNIYYCLYYDKYEDIPQYLSILNEYIEHNNILKPIFILFKIFSTMYTLPYSKAKAFFHEELEYIIKMKDEFIIEPLKIIRFCILYYFEYKIEEHKLEKLLISNPEYKWIYLNAYATYYHLKGKDSEALSYYLESLNEFDSDYNCNRKMNILSNIAYTYNLLDKYALSLFISCKIIKQINANIKTKYIDFIIQHYLYSMFKLMDYDSIIKLYKMLQNKNIKFSKIPTIIISLSLYEKKRFEEANALLDFYKDDNNVTAFYDYLRFKSIDALCKVEKTPYLNRIAEQAKVIKYYRFKK